MKRIAYFLTVILVILIVSGCKPNTDQVSSEDQANKVVVSAIKADHLYPDSKNGECLLFFPEGSDEQGYDIALHEKHGGGCAGDPGTSPVRDRFRVLRTGNLLWYDVTDGEYVTYSRAKVARN